MTLTILYFAWLRERVGTGAERVDAPAGLNTVADLIAWLGGKTEGHRAAFDDLARIRVAIDQQFASLDAPIAGAREVAFFPPVTGG